MSCNSACIDEASISKKKRSLPGHPDPDAEVIALSPRSLLATNRFVCEICHKGFQRDQNLQLHRRGHNLPWRLKQKASNEAVRKKVYVCPEASCAHHDPARALGDLTGIKKHFSRKHGEKKWKCDKCSKRYAVQSDWKAHQKTCGTREYRCDCGTMFSRRDSFITHRAFCDALAEENVRVSSQPPPGPPDTSQQASTTLTDGLSTYVNGGEMAAAMRAPSSPSSQLSRDALTYSDMSNPAMAPCQQAYEFGAQQEANMASLSSKVYTSGMQAHGPSISSKSPGLSLCLGMEPGPGPPGALHNLMASSTLSTGTPPSFFSSTSSNSVHNLGFFEMPGSDTTINATSAASIGATGMLSTFFSSPEKSFSRQDDVSNNGMGDVSRYAGLMAELDRPPTPPFMFSNSRNGNKQSNASISHPSSPSLSATALLQKAAQMGSTASKPFWLQKLAGHGTESSTEVPNQVKWSGLSTMFSSATAGKEVAEGGNPAAGGEEAEDVCQYTEPGYGSNMQQKVMKPTYGRSSSVAEAWSDMPSSGTNMYSTAASKRPKNLQAPLISSLREKSTEEATAMVDFLGVDQGSTRKARAQYWPH